MSRQRSLAIFWGTHVPVAIVAYIVLPTEVFVAVSLLYTVIASIWANVASHWAADFAEQAAKETSVNPVPTRKNSVSRSPLPRLRGTYRRQLAKRHPHSSPSSEAT